MCAICLDWQKGKLTNLEARRNLQEQARVGFDSEEELKHFMETLQKVLDKGDES